MKKSYIFCFIILMLLGFGSGWLGFNFAAPKVETYIEEGSFSPEEKEVIEIATEYDPYLHVEEWTHLNLLNHYSKYAKMFPEFKSAGEFRTGTERFFRYPDPDTEIKIAPNEDRLYYNETSNIFGIVGKDGVPKTIFRPEKGVKYWKKQKGKYIKLKKKVEEGENNENRH